MPPSIARPSPKSVESLAALVSALPLSVNDGPSSIASCAQSQNDRAPIAQPGLCCCFSCHNAPGARLKCSPSLPPTVSTPSSQLRAYHTGFKVGIIIVIDQGLPPCKHFQGFIFVSFHDRSAARFWTLSAPRLRSHISIGAGLSALGCGFCSS